jgi:hypothetical protein
LSHFFCISNHGINLQGSSVQGSRVLAFVP